MRESTTLGELEAAVAVARSRNFRAAAKQLGRSRSALSHAVSALEQRLGVRLFNRTTRNVSPTEVGEQFTASVATALAEIYDAIETASSRRTKPGGTLRIRTFGDAARDMIAPIVVRYLRRFPEMKVDVVTTGQVGDIVIDGFDAGARRADDVPQDMIAVPISYEQRMAVVGSLAYMQNRQRPRTPQDLGAHRCIQFRLPSGEIHHWKFERHGEAVLVQVEGPLILDDPATVLEAARADIGLAYLRESIVAADLAHGRLVRVLEDWTQPSPGISLYYRGRRNMPAGLRVFINLIREIGVQSEI